MSAYGFNDDKSKAPFGYSETLTRQTSETDDSFAKRMFQRLAEIVLNNGTVESIETVGDAGTHTLYHITLLNISEQQVESMTINFHSAIVASGTTRLFDWTSKYTKSNNTETVITRETRIAITGTGTVTPEVSNYDINFPPEESYMRPTNTIVIHWHKT